MTTGTAVVRVMIADDDLDIRDAMADLIASEPSFELVGTAANAREAIELAAATRPGVAVIDVRMPDGGGAGAVRGIASESPETRVVALSALDDRATVIEMLRAGAVRYIVKGTLPDSILHTIQEAAVG